MTNNTQGEIRMRTLAAALLATTFVACGPTPDETIGQRQTDLVQANASTDDKSVVSPTAHWIYTGVSPAFISTKFQQLGARLTNLEVDPNDTSKFTVTLVPNSGPYFVTGWWWYYGI